MGISAGSWYSLDQSSPPSMWARIAAHSVDFKSENYGAGRLMPACNGLAVRSCTSPISLYSASHMCSLTPRSLPIAPIPKCISMQYSWLIHSALISPAEFFGTWNLQVYGVKAFSSLALFFIMCWEMFLLSGYKESVEKKPGYCKKAKFFLCLNLQQLD